MPGRPWKLLELERNLPTTPCDYSKNKTSESFVRLYSGQCFQSASRSDWLSSIHADDTIRVLSNQWSRFSIGLNLIGYLVYMQMTPFEFHPIVGLDLVEIHAVVGYFARLQWPGQQYTCQFRPAIWFDGLI